MSHWCFLYHMTKAFYTRTKHIVPIISQASKHRLRQGLSNYYTTFEGIQPGIHIVVFSSRLKFCCVFFVLEKTQDVEL